jgi:two-component system sensor histidine kinase MtrB
LVTKQELEKTKVFKSWVKIKQSLSLKVLLTNTLFAFVIVLIVGTIVYNQVSSTFINEKIDISKVETQNTWNLAQSRIKSAGLQNDAELNKVVQDFISSSREDGSLSGRETVIIAVSKSNKNYCFSFANINGD